MAISVLNVETRINGSSFPLNSYEEPYGTLEDWVVVPRSSLHLAAAGSNLAKPVFFSFKHLDTILAAAPVDQLGPGLVLSSRVISALLARPGPAPRPALVRVQLRHRRGAGRVGPVCVRWELERAAWSGAGCRVLTRYV